jgi:hypothetical protein
MAGLRLRRYPVERVALSVGDRVKFESEKRPYTVRAVSGDGRWVICTKPLNLRHTVIYTVVDFDSDVRGPDDLIFGLGYESDEDIASAMGMFEAGDAEVSVRHDLRLDIEQVIPAALDPARGGSS